MKKITLILGVSAMVLFQSCATIIHGTNQDVSISSNPSSAVVTIDNQEFGKTPLTAKLSRKDSHTVKIELDGYMPYETKLTRKVDAWIAGNIVFGGLIGLGVDAISGGMYKLTPNQIQAEMRNQAVTTINSEDGLFLVVVLEPKADWEKIGQLTSVNN